ncbi:hypothetical protein KGF54_002638 [Candida jiufengensis]|uniref:uncharacterized protein n=1 Tax=Candida jiufengensis TaxID=497108 RepID=UPI0022251A91|nr:uncharacterized protein KGF54_002638 [Candida jiufengensis]KAI5953267.1 hypothetical protein KGF54_002638 [Candida jiufengensis]
MRFVLKSAPKTPLKYQYCIFVDKTIAWVLSKNKYNLLQREAENVRLAKSDFALNTMRQLVSQPKIDIKS